MRLFPVDTRKKRKMAKQKEIRQLEARRDQLMSQGFTSRAKAVENQIRFLNRQVDKIDLE